LPFLRQAAAGRGHSANHLHSAERFLADAKQPQFGCLVFDIQLGAMSGTELAKRLAADGGTFLSSSSPLTTIPKLAEGAEAVSCAAYFQKTAPGPEVLEVIRRGQPSLHEMRATRRSIMKKGTL